MTATDDQIEAARTKVRNMLHAADHGNHLGEVAVMRMAASEELLEALRGSLWLLDASESNPNAFGSALAQLPAGGVRCEELLEEAVKILHAAISKAEGSTLMERRV